MDDIRIGSTPLLPIFIDLRGRTCLLVDAEQGPSVEVSRKAAALLRAGARLRWVGGESPQLKQTLTDDWGEQLEWHPSPVQPQHWRDVWLVVSFSSVVATNEWLSEQAGQRQVFFNAVDKKRYCSAIWPACVERLPVQLALTTGGHSPALAGYLRRWLEELLPVTLGSFAVWLASWRQWVVDHGGHYAAVSQRAQFWQRLLDNGLLTRYTRDGAAAAESELRQAVASQQDRSR
ncbi:MAG: hypothetical protein HQL60_06395 [Magnetococcales bacterium]|nr:hypothetical protein [Magnetococcales bacterium]